MLALLVMCCFICLAGCWLVVADIRSEIRHLARDYERSLVKDVRSRVQ